MVLGHKLRCTDMGSSVSEYLCFTHLYLLNYFFSETQPTLMLTGPAMTYNNAAAGTVSGNNFTPAGPMPSYQGYTM
jgi:hypothetical protein